MFVFLEDIAPILSKSKSLPRRLKVIFFSSKRRHGFNGVRGSGVCLHRSFPNLISNIIVDNKKQMLVDEEHLTRCSGDQIKKFRFRKGCSSAAKWEFSMNYFATIILNVLIIFSLLIQGSLKVIFDSFI